jgi:transposase-like protein
MVNLLQTFLNVISEVDKRFYWLFSEMVVNGVSTRKIEEITYELCGTEFSKSTISELCKNLDPVIAQWNSRSLEEKKFPFG